MVEALLAAPKPVIALLDAARVIKDRHAEAPFEAAKTFRADSEWADRQGWSEQTRAQQTARNLRVALRTLAMETNERLTNSADANYASKTCTGGDVQDLLVALYENDARALPLFRLAMKFNGEFREAAVRRTPGSKGERAALSGSLLDRLHLVGAGYCDVFTCDKAISDWIGGYRASLGKRSQLAPGGHPGGTTGFVEELMKTWP